MKISDIGQLSLGALRQRRLRSVLTILGIMIGSAVVVGLVSATQGVSDSITGELDKLGSDIIMVQPSSPSNRLTTTEERLITQIPQIETVIPIYVGTVMMTSGRESTSVQLFGIDQVHLPRILQDIKVEQGTFVAQFDAGGVLLGSKIAKPPGTNTFARLNQALSVESTQKVGTSFETTQRTFIVRGIVAEYGPAMIVNIDNVACVSLNAARALLGRSSYSSIFIDVRSSEQVEQVVGQLKSIFGERIEITTSKQILDVVNSITNVLTLFLGGIAVVSLIVAGIGIANIMFVSVMERTQEIGVLKALGFQRGNILWLFLSEALLTGLFGGIFGCILGIVFGYGITNFFTGGFGGGNRSMGSQDGMALTVTPSITPSLLGIALVFAVLVSIVAGLYPSWKASRMSPVEALRAE